MDIFPKLFVSACWKGICEQVSQVFWRENYSCNFTVINLMLSSNAKFNWRQYLYIKILHVFLPSVCFLTDLLAVTRCFCLQNESPFAPALYKWSDLPVSCIGKAGPRGQSIVWSSPYCKYTRLCLLQKLSKQTTCSVILSLTSWVWWLHNLGDRGNIRKGELVFCKKSC